MAKTRPYIRAYPGPSHLSEADKAILAQEMWPYASGSKWCVRFLVTLLRHSSVEIRRFACGCLGTSNSRRAYRAVREIYSDSTNGLGLRRMAGNTLGFLYNVGKSSDVIRILLTITDEDLLIAGVNALGYYTDRQSEKHLLRVIRDDSASPSVRAYAAESLGLHSSRAVKGLIATIADGPLEARFFAARALGWIGDKRAVPSLRKMAATEIDVLDWKPDGGPLAAEAKLALKTILRKNRKR